MGGVNFSNRYNFMIYSLFDINTIFFTVWEYPMSYLEFFGTILNIWCVWLTTRKSIWNWPVGILAVILFSMLFYQIQLYSDFLEQGYYLATGVWGWIAWEKLRRKTSDADGDGLEVVRSTKREIFFTISGIALGTILLGAFMVRADVLIPSWFPEPASFPYLDAFTTVAAFAAQILLILRRVENWYLWILIDVIGVWLYNEKEVKFVALLYFIFLVLATKGLLSWKKELREERNALTLSGEEVTVI